MKLLKFSDVEIPIDLTVTRENPDGGDALGLSQEAIEEFQKEISESFINALKTSFFETQILPRSVQLVGVYKITGKVYSKEEFNHEKATI